MGKFDKNIDNIFNLVGELPSDYLQRKEQIVERIKNEGIEKSSDWLHSYIYNLPFEKKWKRKHIYLLVHDLLNYYEQHSNIDDVFYNIESGIVGDCSKDSLKTYPDEPNQIDDLVSFVRNYDWLI